MGPGHPKLAKPAPRRGACPGQDRPGLGRSSRLSRFLRRASSTNSGPRCNSLTRSSCPRRGSDCRRPNAGGSPPDKCRTAATGTSVVRQTCRHSAIIVGTATSWSAAASPSRVIRRVTASDGSTARGLKASMTKKKHDRIASVGGAPGGATASRRARSKQWRRKRTVAAAADLVQGPTCPCRKSKT